MRPTTDDAQVLVGCGYPIPDSALAIVDPQTLRAASRRHGRRTLDQRAACRARLLGESGRQRRNLHARIEGEPADWLRSGDLGFLDATGSCSSPDGIKDLIIIRGMNHYPQDIELTVERAHPALRQNGGAAFSVPDERGEETLVVVQEVERTARNRIDPDEITGIIREAVADRARGVRAPHRADPAAEPAEDHQRQDPAQPDAQAVAGRQAGLSDGGDGGLIIRSCPRKRASQ